MGARRVDALDGRDVRRWHAEWMEPARRAASRALRSPHGDHRPQNRAHVRGRLPQAGLQGIARHPRRHRLPGPRPRREAPTAAEIIAARKAAHELGHPAAALAYALQFEGAMRQWDVIGKWVPLADKRPSLIIDGGKKWVGPMWSQIDENLILRYAPSKTQFTSGAEVVLDLKALPMVMEELPKVPEEAPAWAADRQSAHRLAVSHEYFRVLWRSAAREVAGIPATVWNCDTRAAGVTEGRQAGVRPTIWPSRRATANKRTTARVYDRDRLEAARRVSAARIAYRGKTKGKQGVS